ncbi:hypothetical protein C3L23_02155 [Nautilia sp. PV-1]|uniref:hypothetical protein n=1 Tax=Nautilia sp. PV-1 TaxID=2579250 RepID=UPI000FDA83E2|nr:hypothetical protein [Nautilia sp. PV-1]AZV46115.1 hypothetical protein C3L23_02155 [Nautilia sp. PV-1]
MKTLSSNMVITKKYKNWKITVNINKSIENKTQTMIFKIIKRFINYVELYNTAFIENEILWLYMKNTKVKNNGFIGIVVELKNQSLKALKVFVDKDKSVLRKMANFTKDKNLTKYSDMIEIKKNEIFSYDIRMFVFDAILNVSEVFLDEGYI